MYNYECKRCLYKCLKKSNMIRHLNRANKCMKIGLSYMMSDEELFNLSIINVNEKIEVTKKDNNILKEEILEKEDDSEEEDEENKCSICNKIFTKKSNLTRHMAKNICQINITNNINISQQNINNINNNQHNHVNVNINLIKSFDEEWNVDNLDNFKKLGLILSGSKYSNTLKHICDNDKNLNVVYNEKHDYGLVFDKNDNKFNNMDIKEISDSSMEKIHKLLLNFHKELNENLSGNNMEMDKEIFEHILKNIEQKYKNYINDQKINTAVSSIISDIYSEKYNESKKICLEILSNNCNDEIDGY